MSYSGAGSPRQTTEIGIGAVLNGMFEIDRWIGSGGMGEIYKGHAVQTGDSVAIKLIRMDLAENDAAIALFRKEASILHNLFHEAIVRYYVFSVDPVIRRPYLAMEFVDGMSLSVLIEKGPLAFEAVQSLRRRLASGLQAAHALGVVHRDMSPDNVILPGADVTRAKIIDFGIARSASIGGGTVIGGGFAGKQNYVSPEQLGLYGGEITGQSDIYSLGLVLAGALRGRALDMGGSQAEILEKRRRVPDLSTLDARLRPLIESMLAPRPEDRPASMAEVAGWEIGGKRMKRAGAPPIVSRGTAAPQRHAASGRRSAAILAAIAVAAALATVGVIYGVDRWSAAPEGADETQIVELPPSIGDEQALEPAARPAPPTPAVEAPVAEPPAPPVAPPQPPAPAATRPADPPPGAAAEGPARDDAAPAGGGLQAPDTSGQATLRPPAVPDTSPATPAEAVARFIRGYDGGACFLFTPTAVTGDTARVTAYGASPSPLKGFEADFQLARGFEPDIRLGLITPEQCPAVDFLRAANTGAADAPRIKLASDGLKSGNPLVGTVTGYDTRHLQLLLVANDGLVYNITRIASPGDDESRFNLPTEGWNPLAPQPYLVIALATTEPLDLPTSQPLPAKDLFPLVLSEAGRTGATLSVGVSDLKIGG